MNRRDLLKLSGVGLLGGGLLGLPIPALASATNKKFLFVFAPGGWDPTRVFAAEFDNPNVDMEPEAEPVTAGGLRYAAHSSRPSVDAFMQAWGSRSLIFNGLMIRSISHDICTMIAMTGTSSGTAPDWPAILGHAQQDARILPHLVLGGPSFPGPLGVAVARTGANGQLEALLSGQSAAWSDQAVQGPSHAAEGVMDRYLARRYPARAEAARSPVDAQLAAATAASFERARALKDLQYVMDFTGGTSLADQGQVAVDAFVNGIARCVTMQFGDGSWDTHADNDAQQSPLWEGLFFGLGQVMELLRRTPGEIEPSMADETVVVVLSEMGRTPQLNGLNGKDHWPYSSAMVIGPGVQGGRVIGGFDAGYYGRKVDAATGEIDDEGGQALSAEALGATLLSLGDVDPGPYVSGVSPIEGVLE